MQQTMMDNDADDTSTDPALNDQDGDEQGQEASPEEQAQYDALMYMCTAAIAADGQVKKSMEIVASLGDTSIGTGFLVGHVLAEFIDDVEQETQMPMSDDALNEAAKDLIEDLRADLEAAQLCDAEDDQQATDKWFTAALHSALVIAHGERMASGKGDSAQVKKRMADLLSSANIDPATGQAMAAPPKKQGGILSNMRPAQ
jgi:hypothetical protein